MSDCLEAVVPLRGLEPLNPPDKGTEMIKNVRSLDSNSVEYQLSVAKRNNSYLHWRLYNSYSKGEAKILLDAIKENSIEIAALEKQLGTNA